jgi:hypothetical protein
MQDRSFRLVVAVLAATSCFLLLLVPGCSSSLELSSRWTDHKIEITGDGSPWKDETAEIPGPGVIIGVKNDNDYLYIGLVTSNPETQFQMLGLGCTAWFDQEGNKHKTFGVQFPVAGLLRGGRYPARVTPEDVQRLIAPAQQQLVILGPGPGERRRGPAKNLTGLEARLGYLNGVLVCELQVPLLKTKAQPYAVNIDKAKPLFIGLESGNIAEALRGQSGASSPSQSSGGRGRGGGRSGSSSDQGIGPDRPDGLKHWVTVHLSAGQ